jgi:uncharacterized RDD family membrane protein YckC
MNFKKRDTSMIGNESVIAPIRKRFWAYLIDWVAVILIYLIVITLLSLFNINDWNVNVKSIFDVEIETNRNIPSLITVLKVLFGFLPVLYFTIFNYYSKGQTIGKFLLRIKVVSLYHNQLGFWHCFERSLGYFASALEFGFGYIQAFWNANRMALHDKIGETVVISLPRKKQLAVQEINDIPINE